MYSLADMAESIKKENVVVLIAVSELYVSEIEEQLKQREIFCYLRATDYIWSEEFYSANSVKTKSACYREIAEWRVDTCGKCFKDVEILARQLDRENRKKCNIKKIIFLIYHLSPRVLKIARELKKQGFEIIVIGNGSIEGSALYNGQLHTLFGEYHMCNKTEEILYQVVRSNAKWIHIFSNIFESCEVCRLFRMKVILPKIVFDQYDIGNGMFKNIVEEKYMSAERICIEKADGLCCRGFEIDYLVDELKVDVGGKILRFFDYCEEENMPRKRNEEERELSICYVGGITTEKEYPGVSYACMMELAGLCEANKCHLHVYPVCMDVKRYQDYIQLDERSDYFHFHQPVASEYLCKEISQYDYGILPIKSGYLEAGDTGYVTREEMIYAATNKYFVYLDAELPIIAEGLVKFDTMFRKEHVLLEWTIDQYDFEYLKEKRHSFQNDILTAKQKFHIKNHIKELIDFYNSL